MRPQADRAPAEPGELLTAALAGELEPRVGVRAPAQAWGVFAEGRLVSARGAGEAARDPAHTAFRIASCTKSFTAAAALLLADDGLLDLEEPLRDALDVPLRILGDANPTVRDALAMRAGFPTDDPWADRQESLGDEEFARLLSGGVRSMWPAGTRYEYANLGYAIVGRIMGLRAGMPFRRVVESRLLEPLGLRGTGFDAAVDAPGGVATGHRPGPDGWEPLPVSGPGAFSPIGGLFSTVADLARWAGVLAGAIDAERVLPRSVAERMQHPQIPVFGDPAGDGVWQGYGLGLVVRSDGAGHRITAHSGGYPGFTTRMAWERASGLGAIVFENAGYTKLASPLHAALDAVLGGDSGSLPAEALGAAPWPETVALAERVRAALAAGELPDATLLDPCVDLDEPLPRRRARLAAQLNRIGGVDRVGPLEHATPASAGWTLHGPRGVLHCGISLTPHAAPLVQRLEVG